MQMLSFHIRMIQYVLHIYFFCCGILLYAAHNLFFYTKRNGYASGFIF